MKAGEKFEKLVESVERTFQRNDTVVTWQDPIKDKVTGESRVVDLSIRLKSGPYDVLIVVQCRDRNRNEGPGWIEEIVTETRDIGANVVVAVSSKGFTPAAKKKAEHYNIILKTLKQATDEEIGRWKKAAQLKLDVTLWKPKRISPHFATVDDKPLQFSEEFISSFAKQGEPTIGTEEESNRPILLSNLVRSWLTEAGNSFHNDLPKNGTWVPATLRVDFNDKVFSQSSKGKLRLNLIVLEMDICRSVKLLPPQVMKYHSENSGESTMHQQWQAHIGEMFPDGGGNMAFVSIGNQR